MTFAPRCDTIVDTSNSQQGGTMSRRDEAITIKVDSYEKTKYKHWCVDHTDGNMTTVLRTLVQYIIKYKPTWTQVEHALATLKGDGE